MTPIGGEHMHMHTCADEDERVNAGEGAVAKTHLSLFGHGAIPAVELLTMMFSADATVVLYSSIGAFAATFLRFVCFFPGRPRREGGVGSQMTESLAHRPHGVFISHLTLAFRQASHVRFFESRSPGEC
jgi:hypothetical protein